MKSEIISLRNSARREVFIGGEGPNLVWLHGLRGVDPTDPVLNGLLSSHRIIAPVAPGFNDLDELAAIDNIHELALDYDDVFAQLNLDTFDLVGHSFGAMVAAEIAAHFPRQVQRLVLLAPIGLWNDAYPVADVFAVPYTDIDNSLWHDEKARNTFAKPVAANLDVKESAEQMINLARSLTAVTKFTWPIPDRGLRRRLPRISAPTLALFGAQDSVVSPRYADDFRDGVPSVETDVIADAGHMLAYERPEAVSDRIERFFAG
jgi:pimeloyl-ACP methyl ester carboxylesterase